MPCAELNEQYQPHASFYNRVVNRAAGVAVTPRRSHASTNSSGVKKNAVIHSHAAADSNLVRIEERKAAVGDSAYETL